MHAEIDRHLATGHVRQRVRHEVGARLGAGDHSAGGGLDGVEAGDRGVHHDPDPVLIVLVDAQLRVGHRFAGGHNGERGEPRDALGPLGVEMMGRLEAAHFPCELGGHFSWIKSGDAGDAGPARQHLLPTALSIISDRR